MDQNPAFLEHNLRILSNNSLSITNKLVKVTSDIEQFDSKVFFKSNNFNNPNEQLMILPIRHANIGKFENGVIEQI